LNTGEVQGPINREPEEKLDPESKKGSNSPTGIRRLYVLDSNNLFVVNFQLLNVEKNVFDCSITGLNFQNYNLEKNPLITSHDWNESQLELFHHENFIKTSESISFRDEKILNIPNMADEDNNENVCTCNSYPNILKYTSFNWNLSLVILLLNVYYLLICVYSYNKSYFLIELLGRILIWSLRLTSTLSTPLLKCCLFTSIFYFNFNVYSSPYLSLMKLMGTGS